MSEDWEGVVNVFETLDKRAFRRRTLEGRIGIAERIRPKRKTPGKMRAKRRRLRQIE